MIRFPNAKINLGLNVVSKREDGFHNIETVFYPIAIKDALEIIPSKSGKTTLYVSGARIDGNPSDNLVIKAYNLIRLTYDVEPVEVHLLKNIPSGAGLGGGSSDAAYMLMMLNDYFKLGITLEGLSEKAASLGADCPFFLRNVPLLAEGIGDQFTPHPLSLRGMYLVLVKPDIFVSTQEAYAMVKPTLPSKPLGDMLLKPIEEWRREVFNDFEKSVFSAYPTIGEIKNRLYDLGALYASMSGSGSSVYGIFKKEPTVKDIFPAGWFVRVVELTL